MFIDASAVNDFGASANPKILLIALFPERGFSFVAFKGNIVDLPI